MKGCKGYMRINKQEEKYMRNMTKYGLFVLLITAFFSTAVFAQDGESVSAGKKFREKFMQNHPEAMNKMHDMKSELQNLSPEERKAKINELRSDISQKREEKKAKFEEKWNSASPEQKDRFCAKVSEKCDSGKEVACEIVKNKCD